MTSGADEHRRVEAVRRSFLLAGPLDAAIDTLVTDVARVLGRERAFFAVIDDASENVRYGERDVRGALPRSFAISADALGAANGELVVHDMGVDRRCGFDPRVVGPPHLRALAGVAVRSGGERIGVLCVADTSEGAPAEGEIERLRLFAAELERLVEAHGRRHSERNLLARDIVAGLVNHSFHLLWQPIVASGDGSLAVLEGLLRLRRAGGGGASPTVAGPGEFLPLAEQAGLMRALDEQVVALACQQLAAAPAQASLSINISPQWFEQSRHMLAEVVERAARSWNAAPARLMVEITEQAVIADRARAAAEIDALRALGVRVVLDDFGTGFSSLSYLAEFRFDLVKLDRSFLRRIGEDARSQALVRATVALVHALGLPVCGEGVETEAQLAALRDLGCDLLQGFHIGRPAPMPARGDGDERAGL